MDDIAILPSRLQFIEVDERLPGDPPYRFADSVLDLSQNTCWIDSSIPAEEKAAIRERARGEYAAMLRCPLVCASDS